MTNAEFAEAVGCHHSMASRLRAGKRVPSAGLLARIVEAFPLTPEETARMFESLQEEDAAQAFGRWLSDTVFDRAPAAA